ncbi:MAG: hypothetical protein C0513_04885 [Isosphaera sp.]|nr:hypothetical protein [Isosphaera sp.]
MNEQDFQKRLDDLLSQIQTLPDGDRERVSQLAEETKSRHDQMRRTVAELQESLDFLRLSVKYMLFDLEATRRENAYLRMLLQTQGGQGQSGEETEE